MSLSRDDLLTPRARRTEEVETPELGGSVKIRALRFSEFSKLWAEMMKLDETKDADDLIALQLMAFVVNGDGSPVFSSKEDVYNFLEHCSDAAAVARIMKAGNDLNRIGQAAVEAAEKK